MIEPLQLHNFGVTPVLVTGTHRATIVGIGIRGAMGPSNKCRDDIGGLFGTSFVGRTEHFAKSDLRARRPICRTSGGEAAALTPTYGRQDGRA